MDRTDRTGKCLCGAVQFTAKDTRSDASACHCTMCRRWAGGSWIGVFVSAIEWQRDDGLQIVQSSDWAERGFCNTCGSSLFYRLTAEGKYQGTTSVSLGALDDPSGLLLAKEWFIDEKPACYAFEGDRKRVTGAEALAMLSGG